MCFVEVLVLIKSGKSMSDGRTNACQICISQLRTHPPTLLCITDLNSPHNLLLAIHKNNNNIVIIVNKQGLRVPLKVSCYLKILLALLFS